MLQLLLLVLLLQQGKHNDFWVQFGGQCILEVQSVYGRRARHILHAILLRYRYARKGLKGVHYPRIVSRRSWVGVVIGGRLRGRSSQQSRCMLQLLLVVLLLS